MENFIRLFKGRCCNIIGMIHLRALPGTPKSLLSINEISKIACKEAEIYARHGLDGVIIENMHDIPYIKAPLGPEITAAMCRIGYDIKQIFSDKPCGIQVLAAGNKEALAIAQSANLDFIRCEGFVFGHVADEGYIESCAGSLLRYRKSISAENVQIYCDIKKKHSAHAITRDVSTTETAKAAEFFMADGVIVTGNATGDPANPFELEETIKHTDIPVLIGSGVTTENLPNYSIAQVLIVGSYFKKDGRWDEEIDEERVRTFMEVALNIRSELK